MSTPLTIVLPETAADPFGGATVSNVAAGGTPRVKLRHQETSQDFAHFSIPQRAYLRAVIKHLTGVAIAPVPAVFIGPIQDSHRLRLRFLPDHYFQGWASGPPIGFDVKDTEGSMASLISHNLAPFLPQMLGASVREEGFLFQEARAPGGVFVTPTLCVAVVPDGSAAFCFAVEGASGRLVRFVDLSAEDRRYAKEAYVMWPLHGHLEEASYSKEATLPAPESPEPEKAIASPLFVQAQGTLQEYAQIVPLSGGGLGGRTQAEIEQVKDLTARLEQMTRTLNEGNASLKRIEKESRAREERYVGHVLDRLTEALTRGGALPHTDALLQMASTIPKKDRDKRTAEPPSPQPKEEEMSPATLPNASPAPSPTPSLTTRARQEATEAAWRTAGNQLVKLTREPLVGLLSRHLGPDDESMRKKIADFLSTEMGTTLLSGLLAVGLSSLPNHPQANRLAQELRVASMAGLGDLVADVLMGPLRMVLSDYLRGSVPEVEAPPQLREANPSLEAALQETLPHAEAVK